MNKFILSVVFAVFALAAQAGSDKTCTEGSCCSGAKATEQTKAATCPMMSKQAKAKCPYTAKLASKTMVSKQALLSPKAMADAGR